MGRWTEETFIGSRREIPKLDQDFNSERMKQATYEMNYEEYFENRKQLNIANEKSREYDQKLEEMTSNFNKALEKKKKEVEDELKKYNITFLNDMQKKVVCSEKDKLYLKYTELRQEVKELKELNQSLLKIHREKSNADREVRPKKKHDGYLILSMTEDRTKDGQTCWRTVIQTPYKILLNPASLVKGLIVEDLRTKVLHSIGSHRINDDDREIDSNRAFNPTFKHRLKANCISGYYEITIFTPYPLKIMEDRVPGQGRDERNRKEGE